MKTIKILILCTGNSCRSQMAHGYMQSFNNDLIVRSAGTEASGSLNENAVKVMALDNIDISQNTSDSVDKYISQQWNYVITVCGGANEVCPAFTGKVDNRLHMGYDDPSHAKGTEKHVWSEFIRVRNEIRNGFYDFYKNEIEPQLKM